MRDNDRAFGDVFIRRIQAMGIRDRPTSFRSLWQNGYVERLIGSIRRECTDHLIVLNKEHLRRVLAKPPIIMRRILMFRSGRMHRTSARSSASETSLHMQSWADYITSTHESSFRKRQASETSAGVLCVEGPRRQTSLGFHGSQPLPGTICRMLSSLSLQGCYEVRNS